MADFGSAKALLQRGRQRCEELAVIDKLYHASPIWLKGGFVDKDVSSGEYLLKRRVPPVPADELAIVLFEAANALRAALDHAVHATSLPLKNVKDGSKTKFPIATSATGLEHDIKRNCTAVPERILDVIRTFDPFPVSPDYDGGNDTLTCLAVLSNTKKHRMFVPSATRTNSAMGVFVTQSLAKSQPLLVSEWNRKRNEITCFKLKAGEFMGLTMVLQNIEFILGVDFPPLPSNVPVYKIMCNIAQEVERALLSIEAAF